MTEIITVHGTPGSGKSSLSRRYKEHNTRVEHVSAGDRLREISSGTVSSGYATEIQAHSDVLKESKPMPDALVNLIIFEFISQCPSTSLVLIDGYPRFQQQHQNFFREIVSNEYNYKGSIHLSVSEEISQQRILLRGLRKGEKPVTESFIHWRFEEYRSLIVPAIQLLAVNGPVITINAVNDLETNWQEFDRAVKSLISQ